MCGFDISIFILTKNNLKIEYSRGSCKIHASASFCKYFYIFINTQVPLVEEERRAKGSPASLASCGRANSAPSNDSGHVSAEPYSLPSVSSTKVCMNSYYLLGRYTKISHNFPISGNVYFFFPSLGSWPCWGPHCRRCHTSLNWVYKGTELFWAQFHLLLKNSINHLHILKTGTFMMTCRGKYAFIYGS